MVVHLWRRRYHGELPATDAIACHRLANGSATPLPIESQSSIQRREVKPIVDHERQGDGRQGTQGCQEQDQGQLMVIRQRLHTFSKQQDAGLGIVD